MEINKKATNEAVTSINYLSDTQLVSYTENNNSIDKQPISNSQPILIHKHMKKCLTSLVISKI